VKGYTVDEPTTLILLLARRHRHSLPALAAHAASATRQAASANMIFFTG
jgi:hypothetical protein